MAVIEIGTTEGTVCGAAICGEAICGEPSDYYALPNTLTFREDSHKTRFREDARLLAHGSAINGFAFEARDITVAGKINSVDEATQRTLLRTILRMAGRQDVRLRYDSTFYVNVARLKDPKRVHRLATGKKLTEVDLTWRATDPFWYSSSLEQHVETLAGDGSFTVTIDSTIFPDVSPSIVITAPSVGSVGTLTLTNTSDEEERSFTYADTALRDGASVTLDCRVGTATRGSTNAVRFFEGLWLRLVPGDNVLEYTGGACTITIIWQPRWP